MKPLVRCLVCQKRLGANTSLVMARILHNKTDVWSVFHRTCLHRLEFNKDIHIQLAFKLPKNTPIHAFEAVCAQYGISRTDIAALVAGLFDPKEYETHYKQQQAESTLQ